MGLRTKEMWKQGRRWKSRGQRGVGGVLEIRIWYLGLVQMMLKILRTGQMEGELVFKQDFFLGFLTIHILPCILLRRESSFSLGSCLL